MAALRITTGPRHQALLLGLLLYVFGLLPFLAASHEHDSGQGHGTCQLCLSSSQAYDAAPVDMGVPTDRVLAFLPSQEPRQACQSLHLQRVSRGPPSA